MKKEIICVSVLLVVLSSLGCIGGSIESYKPKQLPDGVYEVSTRITEAEDYPSLFELYNAVKEMKIEYKTSKSVQGNWILLTVTEFESGKDAQRMLDWTGADSMTYRDGRFLIRINYGNKALKYDAVAILDQVKGVKAI